MPKILCYDTSTDFLSVALACDDQILSTHKHVGQSHGLALPKAVDQLLTQAGISINQLDAIGFGRGPGSFTGIRIATGFAHGTALATDIGLIPLSSLDTLARTAHRLTQKTHLLTAIDAKIGEVYWAEYQASANTFIEGTSIEPVTTEQLSKPEAVSAQSLSTETEAQYTAIGTGFQYQSMMKGGVKNIPALKHETPQAEDMLKLATRAYNAGKLLSPEQAMPVYLSRKIGGTNL